MPDHLAESHHDSGAVAIALAVGCGRHGLDIARPDRPIPDVEQARDHGAVRYQTTAFAYEDVRATKGMVEVVGGEILSEGCTSEPVDLGENVRREGPRENLFDVSHPAIMTEPEARCTRSLGRWRQPLAASRHPRWMADPVESALVSQSVERICRPEGCPNQPAYP